jgi:hypothetical protein
VGARRRQYLAGTIDGYACGYEKKTLPLKGEIKIKIN